MINRRLRAVVLSVIFLQSIFEIALTSGAPELSPPYNPGANDPEKKRDGKVCSTVSFKEGGLREDYLLPSYRSLGVSKSLKLICESTESPRASYNPVDMRIAVSEPIVGAHLNINGSTGEEIYYDGRGMESKTPSG